MAQAMPQENLRITREGLDAFNEGNLDWLRQSHHPEIEWKTSSEDPDAATHRGPDAVEEYFDRADALEAAGLAEADVRQAPPRADSSPTTSPSST
jgi:ketosteroid isomerase-like protein